jgi:hypothetical protein
MATEKEQLVKARELIGQKRYDDARAILRALPDNPTAQEWLVKLERAVPPSDPTEVKLKQARELVKEQRYNEARALLHELGDHPKARKWLAELDQKAPAQGRPAGGPDAMRQQVLQAEEQAKFSHRARVQLDNVTQRMGQLMQRADVDEASAALVVGLAVISGILAAVLDGILQLPGDTMAFTFGWLIAAFNGMSYPIIVKRIDRAGLLLSLILGLLTMFFWFIPAVIITGDPELADTSARNFYKYWIDEHVNVFKALYTGLFAGLIGFGWYAGVQTLAQVLGDRIPGWLVQAKAWLTGADLKQKRSASSPDEDQADQ